MSAVVNHQVVSRSGILVIEKDAPKEPTLDQELATRKAELAKQQQLANSEKAIAVALVVDSQEGYDFAAGLLVRWKQAIKDVEVRHAPLKKKLHEAHAEACKLERDELTPYLEACKIAEPKIGGYLTQIRLAREAEERRQLEEANRLAAEQREAEIEQAEQFGAAPEEVASLCERPLDVMPVISRPAMPSGPVSARDNYKGQVTDKLALVKYVATHPEHLNLLCANETAINQLAKALKTAMRIPGIQVINQVGTSTRTAPARGGRY